MTVFTLKLLWTVTPHFRQSVIVLALAATFGVWSVCVAPGDIGAPYALLLFCSCSPHRLDFGRPRTPATSIWRSFEVRPEANWRSVTGCCRAVPDGWPGCL